MIKRIVRDRQWCFIVVSFMSVDELLLEKERVRNLTEEIEQTVQEIQGS